MGIVLPLAALALLIASVWGVVGPLPEGRAETAEARLALAVDEPAPADDMTDLMMRGRCAATAEEEVTR